jgi:hypothetical protein
MSPNPNHYAVLDPVTSHNNRCLSSEFHPINKQTANTNRTTIPQAVPRTLKQALRLPDAAHWMNAHDKEIDRHVDTLGIWHYERAQANDRPIPFTFTYKLKTDHLGQPATYKARCKNRGDLMRPGIDFDATR